jgi:hypothetical protein
MWTKVMIPFGSIALYAVHMLMQGGFTTAFSTKPTADSFRQFQVFPAPHLRLRLIDDASREPEKHVSLSSPLLANDAIPALFTSSRHGFLKHAGMAVLASTAFYPYPPVAYAKSYSTNARNMERLNAGDSSGGSTYDNNPSSTAARKRRAMTGCKIPSARQEAAQVVLGIDSLSEKECNMRVMQPVGAEEKNVGEFMLQAMRNLDCPTCPYGVQPKR